MLMGIYRFKMQKIQRTEVRPESMTVYDRPENRLLALISSRGEEGPLILGDHTKARLHSDTMQQFIESCTLCLWPNDNCFDLDHHASDCDSDCSWAWFYDY